MSTVYTLNFTDPSKSSFTIPPKMTNGPNGGTRSTDLDLVGSGSELWGEKVLENLLHQLENFACPEDAANPGNPNPSLFAPSTPIEGQLWYNSTLGKIFVFNGIVWVNSQTFTVSAVAPPAANSGDLWWDSSVYATDSVEFGRNLNIYVGVSWVRVVADYFPRDGSKSIVGGVTIDIPKSPSFWNDPDPFTRRGFTWITTPPTGAVGTAFVRDSLTNVPLFNDEVHLLEIGGQRVNVFYVDRITNTETQIIDISLGGTTFMEGGISINHDSLSFDNFNSYGDSRAVGLYGLDFFDANRCAIEVNTDGSSYGRSEDWVATFSVNANRLSTDVHSDRYSAGIISILTNNPMTSSNISFDGKVHIGAMSRGISAANHTPIRRADIYMTTSGLDINGEQVYNAPTPVDPDHLANKAYVDAADIASAVNIGNNTTAIGNNTTAIGNNTTAIANKTYDSFVVATHSDVSGTITLSSLTWINFSSITSFPVIAGDIIDIGTSFNMLAGGFTNMHYRIDISGSSNIVPIGSVTATPGGLYYGTLHAPFSYGRPYINQLRFRVLTSGNINIDLDAHASTGVVTQQLIGKLEAVVYR